jgi:hypothetical protein
VQAVTDIYNNSVKPRLPATVSAAVAKYSDIALDVSKPYIEAAKGYYNKVDVAQIKQAVTVEAAKQKAFEAKSYSQDKIAEFTQSVKERLPTVASVKERLPTVESVKSFAPASFVSAFDNLKSKALSHYNARKEAKKDAPTSPSLASRASELFARANESLKIDETIKSLDTRFHVSENAKKLDEQYHLMENVKEATKKAEQYIPDGIRQRFASAE